MLIMGVKENSDEMWKGVVFGLLLSKPREN